MGIEYKEKEEKGENVMDVTLWGRVLNTRKMATELEKITGHEVDVCVTNSGIGERINHIELRTKRNNMCVYSELVKTNGEKPYILGETSFSEGTDEFEIVKRYSDTYVSDVF